MEFNLDNANICPGCNLKVKESSTLREHLKAKEAIVARDETGNIRCFEHAKGGYQIGKGSKRMTKQQILTTVQTNEWHLLFPETQRNQSVHQRSEDGRKPAQNPIPAGDVAMDDVDAPAPADSGDSDGLEYMQVEQDERDPVAGPSHLPPEASQLAETTYQFEESSHQDDGGETIAHEGSVDDFRARCAGIQDVPRSRVPLEQPSPLDRFGLAVNMELRVLTCTVCLTGLAPGEWEGHLHEQHAGAFKTIKKNLPELYDNLAPSIAAFDLQNPDEVRNQRSGRAPVNGIQVHSGFYCPLLVNGSPCDKISGKESTFSTHLSRDHAGSKRKPDPRQRLQYTCDYQTIFLGSRRRYFRVLTGVAEGFTGGSYELFLRSFKSATPYAEQGNMEPETRDLPSLLRATHWDVFVGPFRKSPGDVVSLVDFPRSSDDSIEKVLCCLHDVSIAWLAKVRSIWRVSSPSIRRLLGMADQEYWKWVETDGAEDAYGRTMTRFISACVRSQSGPRTSNNSCKLPLTPEQIKLTAELMNCLEINRNQPTEDEMQDLIGHLQSLFFSLTTNPPTGARDKQFSCPVQCFIAACSYNEDDTFKLPSSMTSMLAHWQFLLRATGLYGADLAASDDGTDTVLSILQKHCPAHLAENYQCVFDDIRQLQRFVSTLAYNQRVAPSTLWNRDYTILQCRGIQLHLRNLLDGVQSMLSSLRAELYSFTNGKPLKTYIPENLSEDLTSTHRGDSWMLLARTKPREQALMHYMTSNGSWNLNTTHGDKLNWNLLACEEFMCKASRIVGLIGALVHIGAGPPSRGTEQMADQIANGIQPRSLYFAHGQMLTIRRHTKTTHAAGLDAFTICFLPDVLTGLISYYLLVVRPLERVVGEVLYGTNAANIYDLYLYVRHGTQMTSKVFSEVLEDLTEKHIGVRLSLNPIRHIIIAFQHAFVEEKRVPRGENVGDHVAGHTSTTGDRNYAREPDLLEGMTSTYLMDVREWCDTFQYAMGLGKRVGPLVPLRTQREMARDLSGVLYAASDGSRFKEPLLALLQEMQTLMFRTATDQMKPFIRETLQDICNESFTKIFGTIASGDNLRHPGQPPSDNRPARRPEPPKGTEIPARTQGLKRNITQVHRGPSGEWEKTYGRKRQSVRPDPQQSALDPGKPSDLASEHPEDHPQAVYDNAPASTPHQEPTAGPVDQCEPEREKGVSQMDNRDRLEDEMGGNESEVNELGRTDVEMDSPDRVESSAEVHTRQNSLDVDDLDRLSYLDINSDCGSKGRKSALEGLRIVLRNKEAEFKSKQQEELVTSVLDGVYLIAVLPTGGGKSMAFEIPPAIRGQLTIVIVPFRAIELQVLQIALRRGIPIEQWRLNSARDLSKTRLVVVAVETVTSDDFVSWVSDNCTKICAMIFDEAHTVITSEDFRKVMRAVRRLTVINVPLTFLTATLPPRLENYFRNQVGLPKDCRMIRTKTNRPEHIYSIKVGPRPKGKGADARRPGLRIGARFVAKLAQGLEGKDRAIVFTRRKSDGQVLSEDLYDCPFISSDMESDRQRMESIRKWENGETGGILMGTSSLIQGLHYDHVRFVVFVAAPWGLMDLVQGAGRGGRDGKPTHVVVINYGDGPPTDIKEQDPGCANEMERWLSEEQCRRLVISSTMDEGDPITCAATNSSLCDHCGTRQSVIDDAWAYATSNERSNTSKNATLQPAVDPQHREEEPEPIPMPTMGSRMPNIKVIEHSAIAASDLALLKNNTSAAFDRILKHLPTCGICWFLNLREGKMEKPQSTHRGLSECASHRRAEIVGFREFYSLNSPVKKCSTWDYERYPYDKWCYFCGFPSKLHNDRTGFGDKCIANGFSTGIAWATFVNAGVHQDLIQKLGCSPGMFQDGNSWFTWLAKMDDNNHTYNLHRLTEWFFSDMVEKATTAAAAAQQ